MLKVCPAYKDTMA